MKKSIEERMDALERHFDRLMDIVEKLQQSVDTLLSFMRKGPGK